MGGICPIFGGSGEGQKKTTPHNNNHDLKSSERAVNTIPRDQPQSDERQFTTTEKKNILNDSMQSNTTGKVDKFNRNANTTVSSSMLEKKNSSLLFQGCIFESSSIIIKNSRDTSPKLKKAEDCENCYVLIDNVFFVKKSMDSIKVISPHSESQLNCPITNIASTYYLSEGIPLDSIKEISTGKIIQGTESPIVTTMKLVCKCCQKRSQNNEKGRKIKMTFSTSLIHPNEIVCDECNHKGEWRLISLESNFPVWGNGKKIEKDEELESLPSTIRMMGCISCIRYMVDSEKLKCGCYMCKNCYNEIESIECKLCEASL